MSLGTDSAIYQASLAVVAGTLTVADCAKQLCTRIREDFEKTGDEGQAEGRLWSTWYSIAEAVAHTVPEKQGVLVELMAAIRDLPAPVHNGVEFKVWDGPWAQLPVFGASMRETWDVVNQKSSDWVNLNAFVARLSAAKISDFSLYGIWALRGGLEDASPEEISTRPSPKELEAAAVWFIYAGELLRAYSKSGKNYDGRAAMPGANLEDKGWTGYNEERWGIWLERFRLVRDANIPEETKQLITKCIEIMEKP